MRNKFEVGDVVRIFSKNGWRLAIIHEDLQDNFYRIWKLWTKSFGVWSDGQFQLYYRAEQVHGFERITVAEVYLKLQGHDITFTYEKSN